MAAQRGPAGGGHESRAALNGRRSAGWVEGRFYATPIIFVAAGGQSPLMEGRRHAGGRPCWGFVCFSYLSLAHCFFFPRPLRKGGGEWHDFIAGVRVLPSWHRQGIATSAITIPDLLPWRSISKTAQRRISRRSFGRVNERASEVVGRAICVSLFAR